LDKKLTGTVAGTYRADSRNYFLLLVSQDEYSCREFDKDIVCIRNELNYFLKPSITAPIEHDRDISIVSEGVYLTMRNGECSDNAMFRAFQELFGAPLNLQGIKSAEQLFIEEIIRDESITAVFQPIFNMQSGEIHGYESLSRMSLPSVIKNTEELFDKAGDFGLSSSLERLCRKKALHRLKETELGGMIFLNVCPSLLMTEEHRPGYTAGLLDKLGIDRDRVVFELTEKTLISDYALFERGVAHYRSQGYRIAIDDLGDGYAGLKMLAQVVPDYVKLARFLVDRINEAPSKQALAESLVCFSKKIGAKVIAEGIERPEELAYFKSIGTDFGQGYLLALPSANPSNSRITILPPSSDDYGRGSSIHCRLSIPAKP
jgi:EAL domain-containing protein (putative c-di-GMP-specific phosphodiesterase class I)